VQKERDLVWRLCHVSCTVPDGRSLKAIAVQLRQERDHTRDESKLADFEFYSTMIVMKHVDEEEVRLISQRTQKDSTNLR